MSQPIVPRDPLGEWAYRGLWVAIVALPGVLTFVRWAFLDRGIVWTLWVVVGIGSVAALQLILAGLAWIYRHRQWRHWLGRYGSVASFVYYGSWLVLALTLPDGTDAATFASPMMAILGRSVSEGLSTVLLWVTGAAYVATLVAVAVEGERAVSTAPSGRSVRAIIAALLPR